MPGHGAFGLGSFALVAVTLTMWWPQSFFPTAFAVAAGMVSYGLGVAYRPSVQQSAEEVAFSSVAGITIANLRTGAARTLSQKAYLLSGDWKGRLAFASAEGVGVVEPEGAHRLLLSRAELGGVVGDLPDTGEGVLPRNDYLEPDSDEGWVTNPLEPLPTASVVAVRVSGGGEGELLARWPWYVRMSAAGQKGVVATVHYPTGPLVEPGAAIFSLPERREIISVPAGIWPLAVPGQGSEYFALRRGDVGEDLVYVRGDGVELAGGSTGSPFTWSAEVGYWCRGWYVSGDGRRVLRVNDDRLVVYGLR